MSAPNTTVSFLAGFAGGVVTLLGFIALLLHLLPPPAPSVDACVSGPKRTLVVYVKDERAGADDKVWQRYVARPDPEWRKIRAEALESR